METNQTKLTPRQWWLYRLIKSNSELGVMLSIPEIVERQNQDKENGKITFTDLYQFKETQGNHSNCPSIYQDKDILNESDEIDKVVCVRNNRFYIGNESETIAYHNKLMHNVCRDSHKCKLIRDKISQDGQVKLFTYDLVEMEQSKGRDYHEAFIRQESLVKENQRLKELLQMYKNEALMWKERALQK